MPKFKRDPEEVRREVHQKYRAAMEKIRAEGRTHELIDALDATSLKRLKAEKGDVLDLTLRVRSLKAAGKDARRGNIHIIRLLSDVLRTTLGPLGMDKLIQDGFGFVTLSNDGKTLIQEMNPRHPMGRLVLDVAKTQDGDMGDGTTTSVVLLGELLTRAEKLLLDGVHPLTIIEGYKAAYRETLRIYRELSRRVDSWDEAFLRNVATTSLSGRITEREVKRISSLVLEAAEAVKERRGRRYALDEKNIFIEVKKGGTIGDSRVFPGVAIFKKVDHPNMPERIRNARIAILEFPLEVVRGDTLGDVVIEKSRDIRRFMEAERGVIDRWIDLLLAAGANVVISKRGIGPYAIDRLAKEGVLAIPHTLKFDIERLAKATGAMVLYAITDVNEAYLGRAGLVEERIVWKNLRMVFFDRCRNGKLVTLFVRAGTDRTVDEVERTVVDAIHAVKRVLEEGRLLPGGGAPEAEAALRIRSKARKTGKKSQLAMEAFADALEVIPKTLAENAGADPIDALLALRKAHYEGGETIGIHGRTGKGEEMFSLGIVDPLAVRDHALKMAYENAVSLLRIDDIIEVDRIAKVASGE
jgi:chaperonin GroEL (HSP60 family)